LWRPSRSENGLAGGSPSETRGAGAWETEPAWYRQPDVQV